MRLSRLNHWGRPSALGLMLTALLGLPTAHAAEKNHDSIAAGCQPDDRSLRLGSCRTGGHGVFHQGHRGSCRLICPMTEFDTSEQWDGVQVHFSDPDGFGRDYRLVFNWKEANLGSTVLRRTICSIDSNNRGTGATCGSSFIPRSGSWYWLEVIINRSSNANSNVEFLGYDIY